MTDRQTERLRIELELKRAALFELRARLYTLQTDLARFTEEYDRVVGLWEQELKRVETDIESARRAARGQSDLFGEGLDTFDQYWQAQRSKRNEFIEPIRPEAAPPDPERLRAIYRRLARKFHPDTTVDPEEKARRSVIMARVNAAYGDGDMKTLVALDETDQAEVLHAIPGDAETARNSSYDELLEQSYRLDDEIAWTKIEYQRLMDSPLMNLKIDAALAQGAGRNLLKEMAAELRRRLESARATLDRLRGKNS